MAIIKLTGMWRPDKGTAKASGRLDNNAIAELMKHPTPLKIMIFENKDKKTDKHPDFSLCLIVDDEQSYTPPPVRNTPQPVDDSDLPF